MCEFNMPLVVRTRCVLLKLEDERTGLETKGWLCQGRCTGRMSSKQKSILGFCLLCCLPDNLMHNPSVINLLDFVSTPGPLHNRARQL